MNTVKLYDKDSHLSSFQAKILSCNKDGEMFAVVLDQTAFFPEGGGQASDTGKIGDANVLNVQLINNEIVHYTDCEVKGNVACTIDRDKRFRRMQNHSGEHIVSGIVHNLYSFDNVGFHMSDIVTVDFNGELSADQIRDIETRANIAVCENVTVSAEYPDEKALASMNYRSKLELTDNVRIVTIDGYDKCACCAPHVSRTGEIGMIKILDFMRHRGGTRITMLCGLDALDDCNVKYDNLSEISVKLCAKQNEAAKIFNKFYDDNAALKIKISQLNREFVQLKCASFSPVDGNMVLFENDLDMQNLRTLVIEGAKLCSGLCAGFSGNDNDGYSYAISSERINLRDFAKAMNIALNGKGGGSPELIQGSIQRSQSAIKTFFDKEV